MPLRILYKESSKASLCLVPYKASILLRFSGLNNISELDINSPKYSFRFTFSVSSFKSLSIVPACQCSEGSDHCCSLEDNKAPSANANKSESLFITLSNFFKSLLDNPGIS